MIRNIATARMTDRNQCDAVYNIELGRERTRNVEEPPRPPLTSPHEAPGDAQHCSICLYHKPEIKIQFF
jgi:hypothetical protein